MGKKMKNVASTKEMWYDKDKDYLPNCGGSCIVYSAAHVKIKWFDDKNLLGFAQFAQFEVSLGASLVSFHPNWPPIVLQNNFSI